jgi:hypothetical protein
LLHLLRLLPFLCSGHHHLALENLALRQQLAVYKRTTNRLRLRRSDRHLWVWLSRVWPAWRQALVIVAPATVLSWQRHRFCRQKYGGGRPLPGRDPLGNQSSTVGRGPGILVHVHPGYLARMGGRLATTTIAEKASRMDILLRLHT